MADEPQDPKKPDETTPVEQLESLRQADDELTPRQRFERMSRIALLLGYDLIDKLRYWEKETAKLSDDQIAKRLDELAGSVEKLREAYLAFSELEF